MKSLEIKNFKNFERLKLNDLANINLIVGKNNVGKSALLEAISIFASNGDLESIKSILESRGESIQFHSSVENRAEKELERFLSLYRGKDMQAFLYNPIEISADGLIDEEERFAMQLVRYIKDTEIDAEGLERAYTRILDEDEADAIENADIQLGLLLTYVNRKTLYTFSGLSRKKTIESSTPCEYVRTNQIMGDKNPGLFDKIALTPNEKYIVEALKIIEPQIEDINFLKDDKVMGSSLNSDDRVPFVVFPSSTKRHRLSSMGDGINRILTIILAMLNCKNGILLIDEFENGLHYSVQYELWKIIFRLSEQLNIQVFATTHSLDTLQSLSRLISEYPEEDMNDKAACFYLQRTTDGTINNYRYAADNIKVLIAEGEEIR